MSNPPTVTSNGSDAANAATKPEEPPAKTPQVKSEATETNTDADDKVKQEATVSTPTTSSDGGDDEDDCKSIKSEGADEEDALFTTLEKNEEEEEATHPHEQPKDATAAPLLLQSALAKGDVSMDDSNSGGDVKMEEEKKGDESVVHQRVRIKICFSGGTKSLTLS